MKSIRQRLAGALMLGLIGVSILGGATLYPLVKHALLSEFDYALEAKARALTSFAEPGRRGVNLRFTEAGLPEFEPGPEAEYFQATLLDGAILAKSPSLAALQLQATTEFSDLKLANGKRVRAVALEFSEARVLLARDRTRLDQKLRQVLAGIVLGILALAALGMVVVSRAVKFGLQPLGDLARQVENATVESRFNEQNVPAELLTITAQLNGLLARLGAVFQRERRFTSDAAHELTTPIAELRALTDVALRFADDPAANAHVARQANSIAEQMERIVRVLLALGRSQSGRDHIRLEELDASEALVEALRFYEPRLRAKDLCVAAEIKPIHVKSDRAMMRAILFNVIENAAEYSPARGSIRCATGPAQITVENTQNSLQPDDLDHLFEPFWRKDSARSDSGHSGLGLSLVKAYADALGIQITTAVKPDGSFRIELTFVISA